MPDNEYQIILSAIDKISETLDTINQNTSRSTDEIANSIDGVSDQTEKTSREIDGDSKDIERSIEGISDQSKETASDVKQDTKKMSESFNDVGEELGDIGEKFSVAALAIGASLGLMVSDVIDTSDEINKMSEQMGISTETLSGLALATELGGGNLEELNGAIKGLSINMFTLADLQKQATKAANANLDLTAKQRQEFIKTAVETNELARIFKELGISVTTSTGNLKSMEEILPEIADSFSNMDDGTRKNAIAQRLLSEAGLKLIPVLNDGAEGLRLATEKAREYGVLLTQDVADAQSDFKEDTILLGKSLDGLNLTITKGLIPSLKPLIDRITENVKALRAWVDENPELILGLLKLAEILGSTGVLVLALGATAKAVGSVITAVEAGAISTAGWVVVLASLVSVVNTFKDEIAQGLFDTIEITKRLWGTLEVDLKKFSKNFKNGFKILWNSIIKDVKTFTDNLFKAGKNFMLSIANGIKETINIPINFVKQGLIGIVEAIDNVIPGFKEKGQSMIDNLGSGISELASVPLNAMEKIIDDTIKEISDSTSGFIESGKALVDGIVDGVNKDSKTVIEGFQSILDSVFGSLTKAKSKMKEKGADLANSTADGMKSKKPKIKDEAEDWRQVMMDELNGWVVDSDEVFEDFTENMSGFGTDSGNAFAENFNKAVEDTGLIGTKFELGTGGGGSADPNDPGGQTTPPTLPTQPEAGTTIVVREGLTGANLSSFNQGWGVGKLEGSSLGLQDARAGKGYNDNQINVAPFTDRGNAYVLGLKAGFARFYFLGFKFIIDEGKYNIDNASTTTTPTLKNVDSPDTAIEAFTKAGLTPNDETVFTEGFNAGQVEGSRVGREDAKAGKAYNLNQANISQHTGKGNAYILGFQAGFQINYFNSYKNVLDNGQFGIDSMSLSSALPQNGKLSSKSLSRKGSQPSGFSAVPSQNVNSQSSGLTIVIEHIELFPNVNKLSDAILDMSDDRWIRVIETKIITGLNDLFKKGIMPEFAQSTNI